MILTTAKEFYDFFDSIPEERWTMGVLERLNKNVHCHCALGHLGLRKYSSFSGDLGESILNLGRIFYKGSKSTNPEDYMLAIYLINDKNRDISKNYSRDAKQNILEELKKHL